MSYGSLGYTPGAGADVAIDSIGGASYQLIKTGYGGEGVWTPLTEKPSTESKQIDANTKLDTLVSSLEALVASVHAEDSAHVSGDAGIMMLALRSDSDVSTASDGEYTVPKLDEEGRLKVASKPASYADITGDITAIQATIGTPVAGGTVEGNVSRASNVMAFCSGTFNTVNCSFEGSLEAAGDANWFSIQAVRTNANTIETSTGNLSAQPTYAWEMSVNGLKRVRVRCTALTSGTQSWRFVLGTYATEPIPAAQTPGTVTTQGNVAHDAAASGNPTTISINARTTDYTAVASNDIARLKGTTVGAAVVWPYQVPELSWSYPAPASGIVNTTTAVTLKAAAGAGVRNYMCQISVSWDALTNATEAVVRDGASGTVIWRHKIPAGAAGRTYEQFAIPKKSTANTLLEFATLTASGAGGVYPNCDGFTAP